MGCGNSKFDADGTLIQQRFRPITFHGRLNGKMKDDDMSLKKELLLLDEENDGSNSKSPFKSVPKGENLSSHENRLSCVTSQESKGNNWNSGEGKMVKEMNREISLKNGIDSYVIDDDDDDDDFDDDNDDDERMLRRVEHDEFDQPSSPSFRVYFADNLQNQEIENDFISSDKEISDHKEASHKEETAPRKETALVVYDQHQNVPKNMMMKRERKRKSFRQAINKGFNVRSCYAPGSCSRGGPRRLHDKSMG